MSTDTDDPDAEGEEAPETPADGPDDPEPETPAETPVEGDDDGQPTIEDDEQAEVPAGLADVDPAEVEEAAGASADEETDDSGAEDEDDDETTTDPDAMGDGASGAASPAQAGELYVTVVQSITNANIKKFGGEDAGQVDRDHFEQYDLADHFNATMDQMGVGSEMAPHEALLLATLLSVGDGLASETDAMDRLMGQMLDKAMGNGGAA